MVVGFNHNFRYKGEVYHIQTEDSGVKSPNIVTLLYQGGTILASKKTSYADITKVDNLDQVVEELMKEQHKEMLRSLKAGEFDAVIESFQSGRKMTPQASSDEKDSAPPVAAKPTMPESVVPEPVVAKPVIQKPAVAASVVTDPVVTAPASVPSVATPVAPKPVVETRPVIAPKPEPQDVPATPPPVAAAKPSASAIELSLDEVILSYLMGDDK
jgi:hypothetical protein